VVNGRLLLGTLYEWSMVDLLGALYEWSMVEFYWGLFKSGQCRLLLGALYMSGKW
jgi:hypothetical protein